jgi:hypothetical protein
VNSSRRWTATGSPRCGDEFGHCQLDRLAAELERGALRQLLLLGDSPLVLLGLELGVPRLAVEVEHLV